MEPLKDLSYLTIALPRTFDTSWGCLQITAAARCTCVSEIRIFLNSHAVLAFYCKLKEVIWLVLARVSTGMRVNPINSCRGFNIPTLNWTFRVWRWTDVSSAKKRTHPVAHLREVSICLLGWSRCNQTSCVPKSWLEEFLEMIFGLANWVKSDPPTALRRFAASLPLATYCVDATVMHSSSYNVVPKYCSAVFATRRTWDVELSASYPACLRN
jgi:hypothetical protein